MQSIGDALSKRVDRNRFNAIVSEIMSNDEVKTFVAENKLTADEIARSYSKFYEYINERKKEKPMMAGYIPVLIMSGRLVDVSYRETPEHIMQRKRADDYRRFKQNSIIPDVTVKNATFETFIAHTEQEQRALEFAKNIATYYQNGGEGNTVVSGPAGTGKSHLSISILKYCLDANGTSVIFASFSEVLHLIKDSFNNKNSRYTQDYFMNIFRSADLLVLDDIGSEQITDWSQDLLTDVLDGRTKTIITTNLSSEQLKGKYDQRIYSRIMRGIGKKAFNFKDIQDKRISQLPF